MNIDLHTHTILSGHAFGTLEENIKAAKKRNLSLLGITDHGPALKGSPSEVYFRCGDRFPRIVDGIRILFGVEANIINDNGGLDLPDDILKKLDIVIVGLHKNCGYLDQGIEKNTEVLIKAMENKYVKIVSHPYNSEMKVDMEKISKAAIKNKVLLELNASYFFKGKINNSEILDGIKTMVKILKENNQKILINSDAHSSFEVGRFDELISRFEDLGISDNDILSDKDEALKILNINE